MPDGCVITFYSYKGGVGRSFLLANVGATLSRWGYRVLCVDFDLEAPGLSHYLAGFSESTAARVREADRADDTLTASLSPSELDVLALITEGLPNKEIAIRLSITESTVKLIALKLASKLGTNSRAQAVLLASKLGLVRHARGQTNESARSSMRTTRDGLLELVETLDRGEPMKLDSFLTYVNLPPPHMPLALLSAGRRDDSYMARVQQLDWGKLYARRDLGAKFEQLRAAWTSRFDFVLVDSRTGVSDTGGICTAQLPDILVLVFAANRQNVDGIIEIATKSSARRNELPYDRQGLITIPVLSRFDQRAEHELAQEWLKVIEAELDPLLGSWLHRDVTPSQFFERAVIPYFSAWSFGEDLPAVAADENSGPERITYYIDTISALLANGGAGTEELVADRDAYVRIARTQPRRPGEAKYDVYVSYSRGDGALARDLSAELERAGLRVFFDEAEGGVAAERGRLVSDAIRRSAAMVALIGKGTSRWQVENIRLFLAESRKEARPVIPVVLSGADEPNIPRFLRQYKEVSAAGRGTPEVAKEIAGMLDAYGQPER